MAGPYYSDLRTKERAARTGISNGIINGDDKSGLLLLATCIYTALGTEAAGEIIELVDLPPGAVVVPALCSAGTEADAGTAWVLDIGDDGSGGEATADPDRYADGIVLSAVGEVGFNTPAFAAGNLAPYRSTNVNKVRATIVTATALNAGVKTLFNIVYRIKG